MRTLSAVPATQHCVYKYTSELGTPINTGQPLGSNGAVCTMQVYQCTTVSQFPKSALDIILSPAAVHFIIIKMLLTPEV